MKRVFLTVVSRVAVDIQPENDVSPEEQASEAFLDYIEGLSIGDTDIAFMNIDDIKVEKVSDVVW